MACQAPGGSNDITAYRNSTLPSYVEKLRISRFIVGDNAYVPSEHLLTPFSGNDRLDPRLDAYNYYLSQVRMRIEMSFGRLVNKFRIFKSPLQCSLKNAPRLFLCATRLHNFCINEGQVVTPEEHEAEGQALLPPAYYHQQRGRSISGQSILRERVVEEVAAKGLFRPQHNIARNNYGT